MKKRISQEQIATIEKFIGKSAFSTLADISWKPYFRKVLLYPTNDFQLFFNQYRGVASLLGETENLYVTQVDYSTEHLSISDVYEISAPFEYDKYAQIWLDRPAILFSDSEEWMIITDELAQFGEGILVGEDEFLDRFQKNYGNCSTDVERFVSFFVEENKNRGVSLNHVADILNLCTGDG